MIDDKESQETKDCCQDDDEECCGEKHIHTIQGSDDCCEGKQKIIFKMPFGRKNIKDMKDFFMLKILSDHEGGSTGYDFKKFPGMERNSVIGKLSELESKGFLRKEEEESDGKKKVKFFITDKGKEHFETLWDTFQETFSFLGDDVPFEHFVKPMFRQKIVRRREPFHPHRPNVHEISQLETKDEVKDYLASMRHRLTIVQKRLQPRLDRLQKAQEALGEAISKVESLTEFSQEEVKKIIEEIRETYKDVWEKHPV